MTPTLTFDAERLDRLIETRLLVQANSGGGKSYMLRYLLEQTHGRAQHIVFDREGEFATLREKYAYVLMGRDGDYATDLRTAKLLARKVMELSVSVIIDLSDMAIAQQRQYVATFVETLNHLPRALWHECLIVIDEAHIFAPEKGKGSSVASEPTALLLSTGRKRGYCAVLATQRLAKLDKDVAAECLNKLIGRTSQEDVTRAGDELAMGKEAARALRALEPGQFYAYGPAFGAEPMLVRSGSVKTAPPKRGAERAAAPAAPEKIKRALAELADLPKQAADEEKTLADTQREVAELRRKLTQAEKGVPARTVEKPVADPRAIERAVAETKRALAPTITQLRKALEAAMKFIVNISTANFDVAGVDKAELEKAIAAAVGRATQLIDQRLDARGRQIEKLREDAKRLLAALKAVADAPQDVTVSVDVVKNEPFTVRAERSGTAGGSGAVRRPAPDRDVGPLNGDGSISGVQQKILDTIGGMMALGVMEPDKATVAALCGYHPNAKSYANGMGALRTAGLVHYPEGGKVTLTPEGAAQARAGLPVETLDELHRMWYGKLGQVAERILAPVIEAYPQSVAADAVAAAAGYHPNAKSFANMKGRLRTLGLIDYPRPGEVVATGVLFPEGLS